MVFGRRLVVKELDGFSLEVNGAREGLREEVAD